MTPTLAVRAPGEWRNPDGRRVVLDAPKGEYSAGSPRASIRVTNGATGSVIAASESAREVTVVFDAMPRVVVILPENWVTST